MKKTLLLFAMLLGVVGAWAQTPTPVLTYTNITAPQVLSAEDAETFMNQYKNMEGAQYENITSNLKTDAEKNKDKNPKNYEFSKKIKNAQYVHIELSDNERNAVTKEIENIDRNSDNYVTGVYFMDLINELEKMGDFIINVSQDLLKYKLKVTKL